MKKSIPIIVVALFLGSFLLTSGFSQGKIGHLNSDELIKSMPETDSINKILSDLSDEYKRLGEDLDVKYNQALEAYTSQAETLKPLEKKLKESELLDMQKRIQAFTSETQTGYQKRQQELYQPVLLKAQNAIKEVGKENGLLYILDSAQGLLLYLPEDESFNILPLVKKKLGIKIK
ncbi:MAG: OmpH family outer membrane protein [Porphyromonadaceae bacterium]|nr:MAG: OmpH family outer membrane protein [Porphyromonadaceae bacterium]